MRDDARLLVAGASYAGIHMAAAAREKGWTGLITVVGEEPWAPYERPPLSKTFLAKGEAPEDIALRGEVFYRRHGIDLVLGTRITDVDHAARVARLDNGSTLAYATLGLATGGTPRRLTVPGGDLGGVHYLATLDDALALRDALDGARDVVIVGAGFIGLELAATLTGLGRSVHVLEAGERVMGRVLTPTLSAVLAAVHESHGVRISTGTGCVAMEGSGGRVTGVRTTTGETLRADVVLVGIGSVPRTELARQAGAALAGPGGGVLVDATMRTSVPGVLAAGDCAAFVSSYAPTDVPLRLESVQNATDQGRVAGATAAGAEAIYNAVPWFWSDQYDLKLQLVGIHDPASREVARGTPDGEPFSLVHLDLENRVVAVDSVNSPADHVAARRLVAAREHLDPSLAQDAATPLKAAVATSPPAHRL